MPTTQKRPRGAGPCAGLCNDFVVSAATHVPSPSADPTQPGAREALRPGRHPWLAHVFLFPRVQSPYIQSSSIKGWLFTVKTRLPAGFLELLDSLSAFKLQAAVLPGCPTVDEKSLGLGV